MFINLINALGVALGAILGRFLGKSFSKDLSNLLLRTMGLIVIYIGVSSFSTQVNILPVILSLILGAVLGYVLKLDKFFDKMAIYFSRKLFKSKTNEGFSKAFVNATVLFAAGSMGVMGAIEAGAFGNNEILTAKAIIDGTTASALAASQGIGVSFSSIPLFLYQGIFVIFGKAIQPLMTPEIQSQMSVIGGIVIMGIGLNLTLDHDLPISYFIPAIFMPIIFSLIF